MTRGERGGQVKRGLLAPISMEPRHGAIVIGAKAWRQDPWRQAPCHIIAMSAGSWRQKAWRHAVISWRRRLWRQDKGPFFEIFPRGAYLRESFEKRAKNKKDGDGNEYCNPSTRRVLPDKEAGIG
jgi:hypothetical protein